jgi:hypothetical protein
MDLKFNIQDNFRFCFLIVISKLKFAAVLYYQKRYEKIAEARERKKK